MIIYKSYTYSPKATIVSALGCLLALVLVVSGIAILAGAGSKGGEIFGGIVLIGLAVAAFIFVSRKLPDKIAAKDGPKNIKTKAGYALTYVRQHPDQYEAIRAVNAAFAAKYTKDESGKIVKIKK